MRQRPPLRHYTPLFSSLKHSLLPPWLPNSPQMKKICFKCHCSFLFSDPLQVRLFNLIPSVMELVHPHVYLWYKAEESGGLKMKTPTRELLCAHFVNAYGDMWLCRGNAQPFIRFRYNFFFLILRCEVSPNVTTCSVIPFYSLLFFPVQPPAVNTRLVFFFCCFTGQMNVKRHILV